MKTSIDRKMKKLLMVMTGICVSLVAIALLVAETAK